MRKNLIYIYILCIFIMGGTLYSCKDKSTKEKTTPNISDSLQSANKHLGLQDSTIYGVSDEFGMSTFTLITDHGDTLYLNRDHDDGSPSIIHGDLDYSVHYALTVCDNGHSIGTLINIDQLKRFFKDYKLYNGHILLNNSRDTVEIISLSDQMLKYKDHSGHIYKISH